MSDDPRNFWEQPEGGNLPTPPPEEPAIADLTPPEFDFQMQPSDADGLQPPPEPEPLNGWSAPAESTPPETPRVAPYESAYTPVYPPYAPPARPAAPSYSAGNFYEPPREKKNRGLIVLLSVILAVLIGFTAIGGTYFILHYSENESITQEEPSPNEQPDPDLPSLGVEDKPGNDVAFASPQDALTRVEVAKNVSPSIVGVVTYDAFNISGGSEGSGIIMSKDGYIITNAHVVSSSGQTRVKVVLSGGKEYEATIKGIDNRTDLAVLKIDANNLNAATFGDSDKVVTGEEVVAIGNPGGISFANSVTEGIVSAIDRPVGSDLAAAMKFIQTSAAINPGNSGGALVNVYGQVIGINSSKIVATGFEGMGFAIPINQAKPIINDLIQYGYVKNRVRLGITGETVSQITADIYNVPQGVRISEIAGDSDLVNHDVMAGDIIFRAGGETIHSMEDLFAVLNARKPGDTLKMALFRPPGRMGGIQGSTYEVSVKLLEDKGAASSVPTIPIP